MSTKIIPADKLYAELQHFRIQASRLAPGFDLDRLFKSADQCRVVKKNARRQVYRIHAGDKIFFLKRSTPVRPKDRLRLTLLPNRKKAEWRNLHRLSAMGVQVPAPLVRGEAGHRHPPQYFLLTAEVEGRPPVAGKQTDWRRLGEFFAYLHRKGIYHADLHPENIRLTATQSHALLDVQSVFIFRPLPKFLRIRNVGRFSTHFLFQDDFAPGMQLLLDGYNAGFSAPIGMDEVRASARRQLERRYRSRTRRCLTNSSEFVRVDQPNLKGYKRRGFDWDRSRLLTAIRQGRPLKDNSVVAYKGVCIKLRQRRIFHRDRCRTSWIVSRALEVRGIGVPKAMAHFVSGEKTYFLNELIADGRLLNDYLSNLTAGSQKRQALEALALWIKRIHACRLWQRDFKSSNVLCRDGDYFMLDLDSVRVKTPGMDQKVMNLAQLNASVSNAVTLKDRLRFFHIYTSGQPFCRARRRAVYRQIWEISRGRNTANFDLDLDRLLESAGVGRVIGDRGTSDP